MTPVNIPDTLFLILKFAVLVGLALYALFAAIFIRQEQLMAHVLEAAFEPILRLFVILHFAFSVGLILLALMIL